MPKVSELDKFHQYAVLGGSITLSAAGGTAGTFQLTTGLTNRQKVVWMVDRIEYFPARQFMTQILATNDYFVMMLTANGEVTQYDQPSNPAVYDMVRWDVTNTAAAATPIEGLRISPVIHEYKEPVLVLPQMLYLYLGVYNDAAIAVAYEHMMRIWYKEAEIGPEDWYDLLQLRMPLGT